MIAPDAGVSNRWTFCGSGQTSKTEAGVFEIQSTAANEVLLCPESANATCLCTVLPNPSAAAVLSHIDGTIFLNNKNASGRSAVSLYVPSKEAGSLTTESSTQLVFVKGFGFGANGTLQFYNDTVSFVVVPDTVKVSVRTSQTTGVAASAPFGGLGLPGYIAWLLASSGENSPAFQYALGIAG